MGETTTISVEPDTLQRFKEAKAELDGFQSGMPDHSADSFVNALLDTWEADKNGYYDDEGGDLDVTATVRPTVDDEALSDVTEKVDAALSEAGVDEAEIARLVTDDLVTQLPPRIAEELEGRRS